MLKLYTDFNVIKYMSIIYLLYFFSFYISADPNINKLHVPEGFKIIIQANNLTTKLAKKGKVIKNIKKFLTTMSIL